MKKTFLLLLHLVVSLFKTKMGFLFVVLICGFLFVLLGFFFYFIMYHRRKGGKEKVSKIKY